jgi:hypothetical protein
LNYVASGGFFVKHLLLLVSLTWKTFGNKNGVPDYYSFISAINGYRSTNTMIELEPVIGINIGLKKQLIRRREINEYRFVIYH